MPNQKRDRSQDRFGSESGHFGGMGDEGREIAGTLREGAERAGQKIREGYETVGDAVASGYRRAEGLVAGHPTPSVLIGFGLGLGLGILLTIAVTQREVPWWQRDWRMPDSLRHLQDRLAHRA
jgi:hypothetical protein